MKEFFTKIMYKWIICFIIVAAGMILLPTAVKAATGNTYMYLVGGRGKTSTYDVNKIESVFNANKLENYKGTKKVTKYIYDSDKKNQCGTKKEFDKYFKQAYSKSTKND